MEMLKHSREVSMIYLVDAECIDYSWNLDGADPGFLLGGGAPLRNDVTDRRGKQIFKAIAKKKALSQGGVTHPLHPPLICIKPNI